MLQKANPHRTLCSDKTQAFTLLLHRSRSQEVRSHPPNPPKTPQYQAQVTSYTNTHPSGVPPPPFGMPSLPGMPPMPMAGMPGMPPPNGMGMIPPPGGRGMPPMPPFPGGLPFPPPGGLPPNFQFPPPGGLPPNFQFPPPPQGMNGPSGGPPGGDRR